MCFRHCKSEVLLHKGEILLENSLDYDNPSVGHSVFDSLFLFVMPSLVKKNMQTLYVNFYALYGEFYLQQGDYRKSIYYEEKALKLERRQAEGKMTSKEAALLSNLSVPHIKQANYKQAYNSLMKAKRMDSLRLGKNAIKNIPKLMTRKRKMTIKEVVNYSSYAATYANLGMFYFAYNKLDTALYYNKIAAQIMKKILAQKLVINEGYIHFDITSQETTEKSLANLQVYLPIINNIALIYKLV